MLLFSPDGRFVLVANEGEPSLDYTVDPEGSVSIIEITRKGGKNKGFAATVRTADFKAFNNATLDPSIRIFGPDKSKPPGAIASVAQDLEPEFVTISSDSKTAGVTCQENNALATVDIRSATVTKLTGLGFKDHNVGDPTTISHIRSCITAVHRHHACRSADQARWIFQPAI
jgi:DNA-binding beta-propeller fold protein YncE